jgi:hypothetical protein
MADSFCAKCLAESTDESSGGYREGLFGREFRGRARFCPDCHSYVATLWKLFMYFPTSPVGTYRYLHSKVTLGGVQFLSRRVPLDAEQVRKTRLTGILGASVVVIGAALALWLKYRK